MPIEYHAPDTATVKLLKRELNAKHHARLKKSKVTVALLMATSDEGHAVYLNGYAKAAVVGITPYKMRCLGVADAEIVIDEKLWEKLEDAEKKSLMDHELTHLLPVLGSDNKVKLDAYDRPKLAMRRHDWEIGGFAEIIVRHGEQALDMQQIRGMQHRHAQLVFGFAMEDAKTLQAAASLIVGTPKPKKQKQDDKADVGASLNFTTPPAATPPADDKPKEKGKGAKKSKKKQDDKTAEPPSSEPKPEETKQTEETPEFSSADAA